MLCLPCQIRQNENWKPRISKGLHLTSHTFGFYDFVPQAVLPMSAAGTRESWDAGGLTFSQSNVGTSDAEVSHGSAKTFLRPNDPTRRRVAFVLVRHNYSLCTLEPVVQGSRSDEGRCKGDALQFAPPCVRPHPYGRPWS